MDGPITVWSLRIMGTSAVAAIASPEPNYELDQIWLRFRDREIERTFERETLQREQSSSR